MRLFLLDFDTLAWDFVDISYVWMLSSIVLAWEAKIIGWKYVGHSKSKTADKNFYHAPWLLISLTTYSRWNWLIPWHPLLRGLTVCLFLAKLPYWPCDPNVFSMQCFNVICKLGTASPNWKNSKLTNEQSNESSEKKAQDLMYYCSLWGAIAQSKQTWSF